MAFIEDNINIEYIYHEHSDACYEEQDAPCFILVTPGEYYMAFCAGCCKDDPNLKVRWQRYTQHHTVCGAQDSAGAACTNHSTIPASRSHTVENVVVCVCGKTENTIESATVIFP